MRTGRFSLGSAFAKWTSIAWNPSSIDLKCSGPIATIVDSPMADSIE